MARHFSPLAAAAILFGIAIVPIALNASPHEDHVAGERSPRGSVIAAYRDAADIMKTHSVPGAYEDHIKIFHADFDKAKTTAILSTATLQKVDLFWSELENEFLPAVKKSDEISIEKSFARLTAIYADCCKPPIPVTTVVADKLEFSDEHTGLSSLGANVTRPPETIPQTTSFTSLAGILLGLISALVVLLGLYFRFFRRSVIGGPHLRHGVKPLFLRDVETKVHSNLDRKLAALRNSLTAYGMPHTENDKLYFGSYLVNGNSEIVDQINVRHECYATIFFG